MDYLVNIPDEVIELSQFYAEQYGMIIHMVYDPVFFVLKGHVIFRNTKRNFSIICTRYSEKEIANEFHGIIYEVLATESFNQLDRR